MPTATRTKRTEVSGFDSGSGKQLNNSNIEFGLDTFGDIALDDSGRMMTGAQSVRLLVQEAELAEQVGLDFFNIGEHYKANQIDTASHVILAAIAGRTSRIMLGTAVLVLSTRDPVRVFHEFSTLQAVSNGRAELVVGRASQVESFPLFGYELSEYDELFADKLDLLVRLVREPEVTWRGRSRPALDKVRLEPALDVVLPVWVGVGGTPQSVVRAANYGLPLMLAIIGGAHSRFVPLVDLYERALKQFGRGPRNPPLIGVHSIGLVAETDEEARARFAERWISIFGARAASYGHANPSLAQFTREVEDGALIVGSPETVARKIARVIRELRVTRFDLKYDLGIMPAAHRAETIRLFGTEVVPRVRELLAQEQGDPT